jgi:hypothetical protein
MAGVKEDYKSEKVAEIVGGKTGSASTKQPTEVDRRQTVNKDAEKGNN